MMKLQNNHWLVLSPQNVPIVMKIKYCLPHGVWSGHEQCGHYESIHLPTWPQTQHRDLHQMPEREIAALDREGNCWKTLRLLTGLCAIPQEKPVLAVRNFLQPHQP